MRIYIDRVLAVLLVLGLWNFLSLSYGSDAVAAPMATWQRLVMLISTGFIGPHLNFTLSSWIVSVLLAGVVGLSIGLLLGLHRASGLVFEPLIIAVSSLPKVTLYPMVLLICGLGQSSKIAFGFIHGVLPIMLFTLGAAREIPLHYVKTARTLGLNRVATLRRVMLPAMASGIVSGMRLGASLALLGVIIGEMFGAQQGLGFLLMNAIDINDTAQMAAVALILIFLALALNALVRLLIYMVDRHALRSFTQLFAS
ncbi:MAG: ABC transporter permease [Burkholderiaceae bacterium]|jgi:NitT/TauT family transport system permease protein|nr:ABC transporter permease subunit [Polynucleobacter sp.]MCF8189410.1 ABC transporter permease subunit [Sulfuritalea sp.]